MHEFPMQELPMPALPVQTAGRSGSLLFGVACFPALSAWIPITQSVNQPAGIRGEEEVRPLVEVGADLVLRARGRILFHSYQTWRVAGMLEGDWVEVDVGADTGVGNEVVFGGGGGLDTRYRDPEHKEAPYGKFRNTWQDVEVDP